MSWFSKKTDGMPDVGQGDGWTASSWRSAPTKRVPVSKLVSTNRGGYLDEKRVAKYAKSGKGGTPYVIESGGKYYVADGHHRAAAAMARGEKTVTVRVKRGGR